MELLPAAGTVRNGTTAGCRAVGAGEYPAEVSVCGSRVRGDAGTRSSADRGTGAWDGSDGDAGAEAKGGAASAGEEETGAGEALGGRGALLAEALLRLQCVEREEEGREAALHAPQPGEARVGERAGVMGVEQLPGVCFRRSRAGEVERVAGGEDEGEGKMSSLEISGSHPSKTAKGGAPTFWFDEEKNK